MAVAVLGFVISGRGVRRYCSGWDSRRRRLGCRKALLFWCEDRAFVGGYKKQPINVSRR